MQRLALCLLALILPMTENLATAAVITLSTQNSTIVNKATVQLYLGSIGNSGLLLATIDNISLTGTATIDVNLDSSGNGTVQLLTTELAASDIPKTTIALGALGSADLATSGLVFHINSAPIPVSNNQFVVTASTGGSFNLDSGSLQITNPTGAVASFLPFGFSYSFSADPVIDSFFLINPPIEGSVFSNPSQTVLNVGDPTFAFDNQLYTSSLVPIAYLHYTFQTQFATSVPELNSIQLATLFVGMSLLYSNIRSRCMTSRVP